MPKNFRIRMSFSCAALCSAALLAGCAPRDYRVAKVKGLYFVAPPGKKLDRKSPLRRERVPLGEFAAASGPQCRIEGQAFAVEPGSRPVAVTRLDSVFVYAYNQERMREAVEEFRLALDKLELQGCLKPGGAEGALSAVAERVTMPATETSYVRYGFNRWRNYIDLRPGMSVGVQYAFSRTPGEWGKDLSSMDMGTRQYAVRAREDGVGVTIARESENVTAGGPPREWVPDLEQSRMPHYRLFFLTKFLTIKGEPERSATLLGARTVEEIREATPKFLENADLTCRGKLTRNEPECTSVDKKISFNPEIAVTGNGKTEYVTIGMDLAGYLRARRALDRPFTLERRYGAEYRTVIFPVNDPQALNFSLLAGDRITYEQAPPARPALAKPAERKVQF